MKIEFVMKRKLMDVNVGSLKQFQLYLFVCYATFLFFSCNIVANESWLVKEGKTYSKRELPEHIKQIFVTIKPEPILLYGKKKNWYLTSVTELPVSDGMVYGASFSIGADVNNLGALVHVVGKKITRVEFAEKFHLLSKSSIGEPLNIIKVGDEKFILMDAAFTTVPKNILNVFPLDGSKSSSLVSSPQGYVTVSGYSTDSVVAYGFGLEQLDDWKKRTALAEKYYKEIGDIKRELGIRFIEPYYHREARGFFTAYVIKESGKFEKARAGEWSAIYENMASKLLKEIKGKKFKTKDKQVRFLVLFLSVLDGVGNNKKILRLYELLPNELKNNDMSQGVLRYLNLYGYTRIGTVLIQ